jgi:hypothetical protein
MDNAQQQIVDAISTTSNILVTVSNNPTVDELSAALGLTLILDKLDKRATAIFSGAMPPAITFLEPEKTFDNTADSLRDFIIALNKEKADHLRYKVDGDAVKIFITPYKTTLSQTDLEFSQGDYNVEMVIALGVTDQDHLDGALSAHGKILHDAKVMTITAGANKSNLGSNDWHDDKASSLSEMVVSLVNALKSAATVFDKQTSTALLTGIVSATDRFSNDKTSSQVMTLAAQLMAAGANQQLIAAKLQEAHAIAPPIAGEVGPIEGAVASSDGTELTIERDESGEVPSAPTSGEKVIEPPAPPEPPVPATSSDDAAQFELEKQLAGINGASSGGTMADIEKELQVAAEKAGGEVTPVVDPNAPPALPTFNPNPVGESAPEATPPSHTPVGILPPDQQPAMNGTLAGDSEEATVDPFNAPSALTAQQGTTITPDPSAGTPEGAAFLASSPDQGAPALPPLPTIEPAATEPVLAVPPLADVGQAQQIEPEVPELPPLPPLPPLPGDASSAPLPPPPPPPPVFDPGSAQSGAVSGDIFGDANSPTSTAPVPTAPQPGQFKIPGQ